MMQNMTILQDFEDFVKRFIINVHRELAGVGSSNNSNSGGAGHLKHPSLWESLLFSPPAALEMRIEKPGRISHPIGIFVGCLQF